LWIEQVFDNMGAMVTVALELPTEETWSLLDGSGLDAKLHELEVAARRIEAAMVAATAECQRRAHHRTDGHRSVASWVMATTNCAPGEARARVQSAQALRSLPQVRTEFSAGHVGVAQVRELARLAANPRCGDQLAGSEAILLAAARQLEYRDFTTVTGRWLQLADADGAHRAHDDVHEHRNARLAHVGHEFRFETSHGILQGDAMRAVFDAFCDAEFARDHAWATEQYGPGATADQLPRTAPQRRADAFFAMVCAAAAHGAGHDPIPVEVTTSLVMDLDQFEQYTRSELDGTPPTIDPSQVRSRRCETIDGIPVDPRQAVAATFLGRIRRVVLGSTGVVVNAGHTRRLFNGALRDAILATDPTCGWLGCHLRAHLAQVDHLRPHAHGGPTDAANAKTTCRHHNLFKQRAGYGTTRNRDGTITIHRPDGTTLHPPDAA